MARWVGGEWEQREGGWHGGRAMWYGERGGGEVGNRVDLRWSKPREWKRRSVIITP